jgi:hypothetical protein
MYYATLTHEHGVDLYRFETKSERNPKVENEGMKEITAMDARKEHKEQFRYWKHN